VGLVIRIDFATNMRTDRLVTDFFLMRRLLVPNNGTS
jgi:hypothetical protein